MYKFKNTDFFEKIKNKKNVVFVNFVELDTLENYTVELKGQVVMAPTQSKFGGVQFGLKAPEDKIEIFKCMLDMLKFPLTEGWTILNPKEGTMFFKLPADHTGYKAKVFSDPGESWKDKVVKTKVEVGAYFNTNSQTAGLYYKVVSVEDSSE
jgi:hypothetical protein